MPADQRKANVTATFKNSKEDPENYMPFSLTLIPGKMMELLTLETISRCMKDKKVVLGVVSMDL